ncbi:hypothetical protein Taro_056449 [Colocasia esculenta]|uniref:Uncharacterized protein n=1 Tax=Colocasia esculenta TaxID=4460 RepID=A0A843XXD3_COLES|nr:hypothetical protein [Colocasia esculenta]
MRPFTDLVEVTILNCDLAGGNKPEGVTISAMFGHPYPRLGEEISHRVEYDFRSLRLGSSACGLRQRFV